MTDANPDNFRDKHIENAIKHAEEGLSIWKAATKWGVPQSTVQDKYSAQTKRVRCGPLPFITKVEEEGIATWLIERAKRGFGLTVAELLDSVERFLDKDNRETPFKENRPGQKWCRLSNKPAHIWNCNKSASNL